MKPVLLDAFCGAGGAARGYADAGFDIVGVDISPQKNYPYEFVQGDAIEFIREHGHEFDAIHASPPCQFWVDAANHDGRADLITPLRPVLQAIGRPYAIENVDRAPLEQFVTLCGTMFGLPIIRHRNFEVWPLPIYFAPADCCHWGKVSTGQFAAVYGRGGKGPRYRGENGERLRIARPVNEGPDAADAMDIDWMTQIELFEAIPPAYTRFIGQHLLPHVQTVPAGCANVAPPPPAARQSRQPGTAHPAGA